MNHAFVFVDDVHPHSLLLSRIWEINLADIGPEYLAGGAIAALLLLFVLFKLLRRKRPAIVARPADLTIDLTKLGEDGPPRTGPVLELYNVPVRLAALVIAPTGRGNELEPDADLTEIADRILPGLSDMVHLHGTRIYRWPAQLSTQGFANTLFGNVRLPGDRGKGSPWSIVAGRFEQDQQHLLAGLLLCADAPNSLGQFVADRPSQWLDMLRVRPR